jgi:diaminobutyrate-2-oxoglutarate transaminase
MVLIAPEYDVWEPGEHNGTFRGHNAAFVTATRALDFWETPDLQQRTRRNGALVARRLDAICAAHPEAGAVRRGRGMIQGLHSQVAGLPRAAARLCFERGMLIETAGAQDSVLKLLPPLVIEEDDLLRGLDLIEEAWGDALDSLEGRARELVGVGGGSEVGA